MFGFVLRYVKEMKDCTRKRKKKKKNGTERQNNKIILEEKARFRHHTTDVRRPLSDFLQNRFLGVQ
jgi:hypothetical protein